MASVDDMFKKFLETLQAEGTAEQKKTKAVILNDALSKILREEEKSKEGAKNTNEEVKSSKEESKDKTDIFKKFISDMILTQSQSEEEGEDEEDDDEDGDETEEEQLHTNFSNALTLKEEKKQHNEILCNENNNGHYFFNIKNAEDVNIIKKIPAGQYVAVPISDYLKTIFTKVDSKRNSFERRADSLMSINVQPTIDFLFEELKPIADELKIEHVSLMTLVHAFRDDPAKLRNNLLAELSRKRAMQQENTMRQQHRGGYRNFHRGNNRHPPEQSRNQNSRQFHRGNARSRSESRRGASNNLSNFHHQNHVGGASNNVWSLHNF